MKLKLVTTFLERSFIVISKNISYISGITLS